MWSYFLNLPQSVWYTILDEQDATFTTTNANTFGLNLLRRLGLAQSSEAKATSFSSNNYDDFRTPSKNLAYVGAHHLVKQVKCLLMEAKHKLKL